VSELLNGVTYGNETRYTALMLYELYHASFSLI